MDLENLAEKELFQMLSPNSIARKELIKRGVLRTKNIVGEIGEYYAKQIFEENPKLPILIFPPPGVKNIDFISRNGERYSVKTVNSPTMKGTTGSFWNPSSIEKNEKVFEYLLIVVLDDDYDVLSVLQLTWDDFMEHKKYNSRMQNYNISLTKKLISSVEIIYQKSL